MGVSDPARALDATELERALKGCRIGQRVLVLATTTSTNDALWQLAREGAEEGLVVLAETQTAGRGQRGHRWESSPGQGLWFSILLRPRLEPAQSGCLTHWAAQSVASAILRELSVAATVKPPNDIYITDRKVAGVLVEMRAQPGSPHLAIVGIGVNVCQTSSDFSPALRATAISLTTACGRPVPRQEFAVALLRELAGSYDAVFTP